MGFAVSSLDDPVPGTIDIGLGAVAFSFYLAFVFPPSLPTAVYVLEVFLPKKNGQTLGKRQMGTCVLYRHEDTTASLPTGSRLAARTAVLYVPPAATLVVSLIWFVNQHPNRFIVLLAIPVYVLVLAVPALLTQRRRGLHDLVAGTVVVDARGLS